MSKRLTLDTRLGEATDTPTLGIDVQTLGRIAVHVKEVKDWPADEQIAYLENTLQCFSEGERRLPDEMRAIMDYNFKVGLASNRQFVESCGLPYGRMDEYWDAIRAGFAKYCRETYLPKESRQDQR